ncbi:MAG: LamG domain-containing protein [bacterium]
MGDPAKVTDTPSGATGDLALQFAPTGTISDMAVVWDPDGVLNVTEDWTLEAWVNYPVTVTSDRAVVFYYGYPGHGYSVSINYAEGDKLQVTTLGIADMPSDTAVVDFDIWQHIAIVHRSGESITYYINGEEAGSQSYTGGIVAVDQDHALYIGAEWDGALPFTGLIDRIRISDTALSPEELDSDPANPTSVQAWSLH